MEAYMQVVVVGGSKGGVGKTTLSANLAVMAHEERSKVCLLDLDPMQSLARWYELRYDGNDEAAPDGFHLLPFGEVVSERVRQAEKAGFDYLVVDCPPALVELMERAIRAADIVLIPCRPSPLDLEGEAVSELCERHGREFLFVLNAVKGKSLVKGSREYLAAVGRVAETEVQDRTTHASSMINGGTGVEGDKTGKTREEVKALWAEIKKGLRRSSAREARAEGRGARA
jgi:chromosome partitioning protein